MSNLRTKVQFVAPFLNNCNIYYVRDQFGKVWHTLGTDEKEAVQSTKHGEDILTFTYYNPIKLRKLHKYDFKNLILDMLEQMELHDTYEYEVVIGWNETDAFKFMKMSSLLPCDLLLDINKYIRKSVN